MERHHVVNLLGVTRCVGYALALVAAAVAIALLVLAPLIGLPHHVFVAPLMLTVLTCVVTSVSRKPATTIAAETSAVA